MNVSKKEVGKSNNLPIMAYSITNDNDITIEALNLGGVITKILTPDKDKKYENIVLAYENIEDYLENPSYLGCLVGRTSGRIGDGEIIIDEAKYKFYKNSGGNTLHGGEKGFNTKLWDVEIIKTDSHVGLELSYLSEDGEENFPGNLRVTVLYILNNENEFTIEYKASSDRRTLVNLTNHSYFNLSGEGKRDILDHSLKINANNFCELDKELIPTGKKLKVKGTPFDFTKSKIVGNDINKEDEQLKYGNGYDHPWILNEDDEIAVTFYDSESMRAMDIKTNQKVIVFYSMNMPDGSILSDGKKSKLRYAACFETQKLPIGRKGIFMEDSILEPNKEYFHKTTFKFYNKTL